MSSLVDTTLLLVQLDEHGVEVWGNRRGWFYCSRRHMEEAKGERPIPVRGPFGSAVEAGKHALNCLNEIETETKAA